MPSRGGKGPPNTHVVTGTWPNATLDGTPEAAYAQDIARNLADAKGDRSIRDLARTADIADMTIGGLLKGDNYPDIRTIARLETALGKSLIPDWARRK